MQLTMNSYRPFFLNKIFSLTLPSLLEKIPDISLTAVKFPEISRFSIQVVSMNISTMVHFWITGQDP